MERAQGEQKIAQMEQWEGLIGWSMAAEEGDRVLTDWQAFHKIRAAATPQGAVSYTSKPTNWTDLVAKLNAWQATQPGALKQTADQHIRELCQALQDQFPDDGFVETMEPEALQEKIGATGRALASDDTPAPSSAPPSPSAHSPPPSPPRTPPPELAQAWKPLVVDPSRRDQQLAAGKRWAEQKQWEGMLGALKNVASQWTAALQGLILADVDMEGLQQCSADASQAIEQAAQEVQGLLKERIAKADQAFERGEGESFAHATLAMVEPILQQAELAAAAPTPPRLPQPDANAMKRADERPVLPPKPEGPPKVKPAPPPKPEGPPKVRPAPPPKPEGPPKVEPPAMGRGSVILGLCVVIGTGWVIYAQRGAIGKTLSRWFRSI